VYVKVSNNVLPPYKRLGVEFSRIHNFGETRNTAS